MCVCMHALMYVRMHICMYEHACTYVYMSICMYISMYVYMYMNTHVFHYAEIMSPIWRSTLRIVVHNVVS